MCAKKTQSEGATKTSNAVAVPHEAALDFNLANAAFRKANWDDALAHAEAALARVPSLSNAAVLRARCLTNLGRTEQAVTAYSEVLAAEPSDFAAHLELGNIRRRQGDREKTILSYSRAIASKPSDARGHLALARALEENESHERAAVHYHRAVNLSENSVDIHHAMGFSRLEQGDAARALEALRQAQMASSTLPRDAPSDLDAEVLIDLARALIVLGLMKDAHRALEQASKATGKSVLLRLAQVSYSSNQWQEAVAVMRRALSLYPESAEVHLALVEVLSGSWQLEEAMSGLEKAEASVGISAEVAMVLRAQVAGKMGDADKALAIYQDLWDGGNNATSSSLAMTALYSDNQTPDDVADLHRCLFADLGKGARTAASFPNDLTRDRPLRIGMVTGDLHHQHPVNLFLQPLLANWYKDRLPLTVYFTGRTQDEQTRLAKSRVSSWREIGYGKLATQVAADRIDILIDLAGHTSTHQMAAFAQRMAPVQATFLGYPGSTGVPNIDWLFGDQVVTPVAQEQLYSERIMRLPHTVFCYAPEDDYPSPEFGDAMLKRPLTFGSFNNIPKLTPRTVQLYCDVLKAVPHSRLLLKAPSFQDAGAVARYTAIFAEQGIDADRLMLRGPVSLARMMDEYADVDMGLDSAPYNGGTTTLQALWMGVPVVVMEGGHFVSRMGASFMKAAGLSEWVARDHASYVDCARRMSLDRQALLLVKKTLRDRVRAQPSWDIQAYSRHFADCLLEMWEDHIKGAESAKSFRDAKSRDLSATK